MSSEIDRYCQIVCGSEENEKILHRLKSEFPNELNDIFDLCSEIFENCRIVNCDVFWIRVKELEKRFLIS